MTITDILPAGAFFATRYFDQSRNFMTRRIYYDNGLVKAYDSEKWWTVCTLTPEQIIKAREAILMSGITHARDLYATGIFDTAMLTYTWRINDQEGIVTNWIYPAQDHPAFEILDKEMDKFEPL